MHKTKLTLLDDVDPSLLANAYIPKWNAGTGKFVFVSIASFGASIDHATLLNVTANQHHAEVHSIIGGDHNGFPADATKFLDGTGAFSMPPAGFTNPMTTQDDIIIGGTAGAAARLAKGTGGQVLTIDNVTGHITWETPSGGGGSGASTADHFVNTAHDADLSNQTTIDDLVGSADAHPASANAKDDEFDGSSSVTWTSFPTAPNAYDINTTRKGHAYMKASGSGSTIVGKYQAQPGSYPYTVTCKVAGSTRRQNYQRGGGICLLPASPTASTGLQYLGMVFNSTMNVSHIYYSNMSTYGGVNNEVTVGGPWGMYFKMVVNSASSVDYYYSTDGYAWIALATGLSPTFTPANIGFGCSEEASGGVEAYFGWFRVS